MLYRGQKYGKEVGPWWTTSKKEAYKFAMSRGGNRDGVVLALDEDSEGWLKQFLQFEKAGDEGGSWYLIPIDRLKERWTGVQIESGFLSLDFKEQ